MIILVIKVEGIVGRGYLEVIYVGKNVTFIENPLMPLTAGLNIVFVNKSGLEVSYEGELGYFVERVIPVYPGDKSINGENTC